MESFQEENSMLGKVSHNEGRTQEENEGQELWNHRDRWRGLWPPV